VAAGGTTVDPAVLQQLAIPGRGRRISGETDIQPSDETQSLMIFEGVTGVSGTIALCVSPSGVVAEERMWKSTGYDDYDEKLLAAVHEWRYRPYLHDGTPVPVCSTVEFKYKLDASE
jgi:TonB family protein